MKKKNKNLHLFTHTVTEKKKANQIIAKKIFKFRNKFKWCPNLFILPK